VSGSSTMFFPLEARKASILICRSVNCMAVSAEAIGAVGDGDGGYSDWILVNQPPYTLGVKRGRTIISTRRKYWHERLFQAHRDAPQSRMEGVSGGGGGDRFRRHGEDLGPGSAEGGAGHEGGGGHPGTG